MASTTAMCSSFKRDLLKGHHQMDADTFKIALYTSSATHGAATTDYTTTNEVTGTGYTAGGQTLDSPTVTLIGTTAIVDFADETFSNATIDAASALIYNTTTDGGSGTTDAIAVLDFGGDKRSTNGDFVIQFPNADASNAVIRIA